jgi:hypothetical protein
VTRKSNDITFALKPINGRTISLRFLDIIFRVLRHEVSVYNVYITNQFHIVFAQGGEGGEIR